MKLLIDFNGWLINNLWSQASLSKRNLLLCIFVNHSQILDLVWASKLMSGASRCILSKLLPFHIDPCNLISNGIVGNSGRIIRQVPHFNGRAMFVINLNLFLFVTCQGFLLHWHLAGLVLDFLKLLHLRGHWQTGKINFLNRVVHAKIDGLVMIWIFWCFLELFWAILFLHFEQFFKVLV